MTLVGQGLAAGDDGVRLFLAALQEYQQELANNPGEPRVAEQISEIENQLHGNR